MADESIEIGSTPDPAATAPIEEPIAPEAANGSGEAPSAGKTTRHLEVDAETSDEIFKIFGEQIERTKQHWGYENITGPQRDAGHRMVATTEHLLAHTMAMDPERTIKMWTELNHKPPSKNLLDKVQSIEIEQPKTVLDSLTAQVKAATTQVSKINDEQKEIELRKLKQSMVGPHGDAVARKKEYTSSLVQNFVPPKHNLADDGGFMWEAFTKAVQEGSKASQMIMQHKREVEMGSDIFNIDKELKTMDGGHIKIKGGNFAKVKDTLGAMGINVSKALKIDGIAKAARAAMTKKAPAPGPNITAQTIAARNSQNQSSGIEY